MNPCEVTVHAQEKKKKEEEEEEEEEEENVDAAKRCMQTVTMLSTASSTPKQ